jgi:catechol 2,3-dioxygenase-like lactoylglutathione lyase family enzyme
MTIDPVIAKRFDLGPIDQISFAVRDVDEAVPRYQAMFGGEFAVCDVPGNEVIVYGEPSSTDLRLAFGRSGDVEVELVEVLTGSWPTLRWLDEHGEGLHHIRFRVDDVAGTRAELEAAGFTLTLTCVDTAAYAYLESPLLNGMTIELLCR